MFGPEIVEKGPFRYVAGRDYAVQSGRAEAGVARIRVLEVRREELRQIRYEGAPSRRASGTWRPERGVTDATNRAGVPRC